MIDINLYTNEDSNNGEIFYGSSNSNYISCSKINKLKVSTADELITNAIKLANENEYTLCAFGPLKSTQIASGIYDTLEKVIKSGDFDIFYLTLYGDKCSMHDTYTYNNLNIQQTFSPHGIECILISPSGLKILKGLIQKYDICEITEGRGWDFYLNCNGCNLILKTTYPPLIMVDISKRKDNLSLIKASICREEINLKNPIELSQRYTGNMNIFWFFIIIVFILLIAIMLLKISSYSDNINSNYDGNLKSVPVGKLDPTGTLID